LDDEEAGQLGHPLPVADVRAVEHPAGEQVG